MASISVRQTIDQLRRTGIAHTSQGFSRVVCRPSRRLLSHSLIAHSPLAKRVDDDAPPSTPSQIRQDDSSLTLILPDGRETRFDNQHLLDHCRCQKCFHPATKQRLKTLTQFPADVKVRQAEMTNDGLRVAWGTAETHESYFPISALERAAYDPPLLPSKKQDRRTLWNASIAKSPPTVTYQSVMPEHVGETEAEMGVLTWLDKVHEYGFCNVTGVPATPEATETLIRRISHIRETHYGGFWDFTANMSHGDLAYSNEALPVHTDTTYFTDPAGLQIFHLLSHPPPGTGGSSSLVDGFYTAALLRQSHPESYDLLSRLGLPAHASGTKGSMLRPINRPTFTHDHNGELTVVRWNNEDRGVIGGELGWKPEDVRNWYTAARQYEALNKSVEAEYWNQMQPGTVVVIDNWRVMHGRAAFTGSRRMCGAYIGADDWKSRRQALRHELSGSKGDWESGW